MILQIFIWFIATVFMVFITIIVGKYFGKSIPVAVMASFIVISNILATKLILFGPFVVPAGVLVFSVTFLITDLISELWGKDYARQAVWGGLLASIFLAISAIIAVNWPIAPFMNDFQESFKQVLGFTPRIVIASTTAYFVSQHHDVWAFHWWKKKTKGKHLWIRNNASTIISQGADSVIFISIAFIGISPILPLIFGSYIVKVLIALLDTPFAYFLRWIYKKI